MQATFNMMVIDHFGFLVSEYRFWVGKILDHDPDIMLEGCIEFQSPNTVVFVAGERYATEVSPESSEDITGSRLAGRK